MSATNQVFNISGSDITQYFNVISTSNTTIDLDTTYAGNWVRCTAATTITVNVRPQSSVTWVGDVEIIFEQAGNGAISINPGSGVTVNIPASTSSSTGEQYSVIGLKRVGEDVWTLFGNLVV